MAKLKRLNNRRIESPPREPEIFYKGPNAWAMRSPSPLRWNSSRGDYSDERERERIYSYEGFGRTDEAGKKAMKTKIKEQFRSWYRNSMSFQPWILPAGIPMVYRPRRSEETKQPPRSLRHLRLGVEFGQRG